MIPRTLASLAHALGASATLEGALVALGEALTDVDPGASLALVRYDARRQMLGERISPRGADIQRTTLETTLDHLPARVRDGMQAGNALLDLADKTADYVRLFGFGPTQEGSMLAVRGLRVDGALAAVLAICETRKIFGTRASDRIQPALALFDLAFARLAERDAREEAVRTLEDVTRRVHGDYVRKLRHLERELAAAPTVVATGGSSRAAEAQAAEEVRQALTRAEQADRDLAVAVDQLEQTQQELHRRHELVRQRTRTLYLLDRLLTVDATSRDPRVLVDGLLALVGDDMQAQRCTLMLTAPEPGFLYIAAARGLAHDITEGARIRIGEGVAGRVAQARVPLLVQDVQGAAQHPLLHDQFFTTGSFISFPLVYHERLVGVVNLTNRAKQGVYTEDDVERVRLLGLVIALVASSNNLAARLLEHAHGQ